MKKVIMRALALVALLGASLHAQDVVASWQGTLHAGKDLRIILNVSKDDGKLKGQMYSIDQGAQPFKVSNILVDGSSFKFAVELIGATYDGKLSGDGKTIVGTWSQGPNPLPLNLVRATKETAWEIPPPPAPPKLMAADADPSFDVATIKPNDSGGTSMQSLTVNGRNFATRNSSLGDLIMFAYSVQSKQIVGAPDWLDKDRYDIAAVPDVEGAPSPDQLKSMLRKLLAERFGLKFHHDKRELSAYVLTVAKSGQKLTPTEVKGPLPGIGMRPGADGLMVIVRNARIQDFTGFMQSLVLDRPVVDQTALPDRYDFTFKFTPDDSQFNGHPPPMPKGTETTETAPGLFEAMQQQLGLKLSPEKTQVDVIAVDHVEKPSAN